MKKHLSKNLIKGFPSNTKTCPNYQYVDCYVFQDGFATNINKVDFNIKNAKVSQTFLDSLYVGRCADEQKSCSQHFGDITDVNMWNKALTENDMKMWTNCR